MAQVESNPEHRRSKVSSHFREYVTNNCSIGSIALASGEIQSAERVYLSKEAQERYFEDTKRLRMILHHICPSLEPDALSRVKVKDIQRGYTGVLSTLLWIDSGDQIQRFVHLDSLEDKHGPWDTKPTELPVYHDDSWWEDFAQAQWKFFVPQMEGYSLREWKTNRILPFRRVKMLGEGGSGKVFKIQVNNSYNCLHRGSKNKLDKPSGDLFCLKTFLPDQKEEWEQERKTLELLREGLNEEDGAIGFYGCYTQDTTVNIILEYANGGTLEDYLREVAPPTTTVEIRDFWNSMAKLISVLARLFNLEFYAEEKKVYQGWHFDVKNENILVCLKPGSSVYNCDFKLADFGSSLFRTQARKGATHVRAAPGTRTNGAPELYREDPFGRKPLPAPRVGPEVDAWSLGCVYSEVATWVVHGYRRLKQYRQLRHNENRMTSGKFADPGCFHNGAALLECVTQNHQYLLHTTRNSDRTTGLFLYIVESAMLVVRPEDRKAGLVLLQYASNTIETHQTLSDQELNSSLYAQFDNEYAGTIESLELLGETARVGNEEHSTHHNSDDHPLAVQLAGVPSTSTRSQLSSMEPDLPADDGSLDTGDLEDGPLGTTGREPLEPSRTFTQRSFGDPFIELAEQHDGNRRRSALPGRFKRRFRDHAPRIFKENAKSHSVSGKQIIRDLLLPSNLTNGVHATSTKQDFEAPKDRSTATGADTGFEVVIHQDQVESKAESSEPTQRLRTTSQPLPALTLDKVWQWRNDSRGNPNKKPVPGNSYLRSLFKRDFILLFDNSPSMRTHWSNVKHLADPLTYILKQYDDNGVEVYFTDSVIRRTVKSTTALRKFLDDSAPRSKGNSLTHMLESLSMIFNAYRVSLNEGNKSGRDSGPKKTILFIFTDGNWQPDPSSQVEASIASMVQTLKSLGYDDNQFGIQFIRYGKHPEGIAMLDHLDDEICDVNGNQIKPDIVDTEPFKDCNVLKILLGSCNKWFDQGPEEATRPSTDRRTPSPAHSPSHNMSASTTSPLGLAISRPYTNGQHNQSFAGTPSSSFL